MCTWLCAQMLAVLLASIRHASMLPHAETSLASVQAGMLLVHIVDPISPRCVFRDLERGDMTAAVRKRRWQIHTPNWHFMKLIHWACEPQFVLAVKHYSNGSGYSSFLAHCQYDMMVRCIDWAIFYFWRLEVVVQWPKVFASFCYDTSDLSMWSIRLCCPLFDVVSPTLDVMCSVTKNEFWGT